MALCVTAKKVTAKQIGLYGPLFLLSGSISPPSQTRGDAKCYKVFVVGAEEHVTNCFQEEKKKQIYYV